MGWPFLVTPFTSFRASQEPYAVCGMFTQGKVSDVSTHKVYRWVSDPSLGLHAPFFDSSKEGCMVAFGLVRIRLGKRGNGTVERIPVTQVAADLCRVAGARVRARQGCRT